MSRLAEQYYQFVLIQAVRVVLTWTRRPRWKLENCKYRGKCQKMKTICRIPGPATIFVTWKRCWKVKFHGDFRHRSSQTRAHNEARHLSALLSRLPALDWEWWVKFSVVRNELVLCACNSSFGNANGSNSISPFHALPKALHRRGCSATTLCTQPANRGNSLSERITDVRSQALIAKDYSSVFDTCVDRVCIVSYPFLSTQLETAVKQQCSSAVSASLAYINQNYSTTGTYSDS